MEGYLIKTSDQNERIAGEFGSDADCLSIS